MNLKRIEEWLGTTVPKTSLYTEFDPLGRWDHCGPVQTKLWQNGSVFRDVEGRFSYASDVNNRRYLSKTIVTDDASLRRAICEIAEQVAEGGK